MKWKFGLLDKEQLAVMGLVLMAMACKRKAPRYEPKLPGGQENISNSIMEASWTQGPQSRPKDAQAVDEDWYTKLKITPEGKMLLKHSRDQDLKPLYIAPDEDPDAQNDWHTRIEASLTTANHKDSGPLRNLPDALLVNFPRAQGDDPWDKRILMDIASITISANPVAPNSERHTFALTAFVAEMPKNRGKRLLIVYVKKDQEWYFYKNNDPQAEDATCKQDSNKKHLSTINAMRFASEAGILFLYQKIR
ncbi:hypothetical protein CE557_244 [Cardinium endosymbiont of Sogatella furcifera]|uniref:hypothetical protein n=1 Tax=Cardinium endosymbiont of Sogatella furcifera TaxID=650378 RepID=UPI000E0D5EAF|nr:hypothetical protein [Cardinium endosymbiont of Sogatella furcifera]AXI24078.1 hypothetical protein CE557_244 [Cardinium endosymbiont of Sogatella furcifera]